MVSDPSTSSSERPSEHTSRMGASTASPADTIALAAPDGHAPPDQGCRVCHVEPAGWFGVDGDNGGGGIGGGILSTGLISDETPVMSNDRVDRCTALLDDALQPPSLLCAPPLFEADLTGVVSGVL